MNVHTSRDNESSQTRNRTRNVATCSTLCSPCLDGCTGTCDVFKSSLRGPEAIHREFLSSPTHAAQSQDRIDYSHLNILSGVADADAVDAAKTTVPNVDTTAVYGHTYPVQIRMPIFTGAIGSGDVRRVHWDALATGAAVCGVPFVMGANVLGADPNSERAPDGRVVCCPEMERLVKLYRQWQDRRGDIIMQMNIDDARRGVAQYAVEKLGVDTIELKWTVGGGLGETRIHDLDRALELRRQGDLVTPNPENPAIQAAFRSGDIREFERHSRVSFIDEQSFTKAIEHVQQQVGAKRVLLRATISSPHDLATVLKWSSKTRIDLLTIDGLAPSRTGEERGIPTFYLQCMAHRFAARLSARGQWVPDLVMDGRFSTEDQLFKALALGAPYFRAVGMGQSLRIPLFVGDNIEGVLRKNRITQWKDLPAAVRSYGERPEQIFVTYESLARKYGHEPMEKMPLGAMAMYTYMEKLRIGLGQLLAAARNFRLDTLKRTDLVSMTDEAARVSGIPHIMDAGMEEAERILDQ